jgi:hypothetical protein
MERDLIIKGLLMYFKPEELICPHCFKSHGAYGLTFLSTSVLADLLFIRSHILPSPILINNYHVSGSFSQRGLRCNLCPLVQSKSSQNTCYLSAHIFGCAFDFDCQGYSADEVRLLIIKNSSFLPYPLRLESSVSWVHFDTFNYFSSSQAIQFSA